MVSDHRLICELVRWLERESVKSLEYADGDLLVVRTNQRRICKHFWLLNYNKTYSWPVRWVFFCSFMAISNWYHFSFPGIFVNISSSGMAALENVSPCLNFPLLHSVIPPQAPASPSAHSYISLLSWQCLPWQFLLSWRPFSTVTPMSSQ